MSCPFIIDSSIIPFVAINQTKNAVRRYRILEWTTSLDTSSRTLFVREGGREDIHVSGCPRHVELRNNVRLLLNVELRNYVISRQIVI